MSDVEPEVRYRQSERHHGRFWRAKAKTELPLENHNRNHNDNNMAQPFRSARALLPWIVTTTAAAAIGAMVNSYLSKASPAVSVSDVGISRQYNDRFGKQIVKVPQDEALFRHLNESEWTESIRDTSVDLHEINETLLKSQGNVEDLIKDMEDFRVRLPDMMALLSGNQSDYAAQAFFDKWEPLSYFIYVAIKGQIQRRAFVPPSPSHVKQKTQIFSKSEKLDGDFKYVLVSKVGSKYPIRIGPVDRKDNSDIENADNLASALTAFDQVALIQYLKAAEQSTSAYEMHSRMKDEIDEYLKGYSRWVLTVLISNSGSDAISFSPNAEVYVNTRATNAGADFTIMDVQVRQKNGSLEPITVKGGESAAESFVSADLVLSNEKWRELLKLFSSSSRNCFVVLHAVSDRWLMSPDLKTPVRSFGPSSKGQRLPEKEISGRFGE